MRRLLIAAVLATSGVAFPAAAQQQDRVLVLYGDDRCPRNATGEEIVVCVRRPEAERYRIPKELRQGTEISPENQSWAARAESTMSAGASTGIGSCSAAGSGGWSGCYKKQMDAARAEKQAAAASDARSPEPKAKGTVN